MIIHTRACNRTIIIRTKGLKACLHKSRLIALCIHPFVNIQRAFYAGISNDAEDEGDDNE